MDSGTLRVHRPQQGRAAAIDQAPLCGQDRYTLERKVLAKVKKSPRFLLRELFDFFQGRADCFPSNAKVSKESGISLRNVQLLLRQLETDEIVKSVADPSIASQRRIVLLDHPNAFKTLRALGAVPDWVLNALTPGGARVAPLNRPRGAMAAPQGAQNPPAGGATVAPEPLNSKPASRNRAFKALRGMNPGGGAP
jgi:hypothetical protein